MRRATTETLYFETGPANPPTFRVKPGEVFEVQTQLNRGPWLDTHPDGPRLTALLRGGNPSSGCIDVEGAEPGMALTVHVGPISLDPVGFTRFRGANGAMPGWLGASGIGERSRIVEIRDGLIHWGEGRTLPVRPMLGFVGTAPEFESWANVWAGTYGGNLDVQELTTGAAITLPVNVPGARLHVGDMHAIQGDGEICGAGGIEASGVVQLRCELTERPAGFVWPRIVDATHRMVAAQARPCEDAFRLALEAMILWLEADGLPRGEAYLWLGQVLEARCTQFVNPTFTYLAKVRHEHWPSNQS
ncbi:MAG: acetamidase/formamidase family protein [Isosphaeraceae bacterium]